MARAPFQVLVYPHYTVLDHEREYLLLKRADASYWQGVAGGGKGCETPLDAARREVWEEAGIPRTARFLQLITVLPIPASEFRDSARLWGSEVRMIPQYCFGVWAEQKDIVLSPEHVEYKWLKYEDAYRLVKYEGDKIALWELATKLRKEKV